MSNRLYQVKDIMEMFGITRDTIKYYEKRGLITPAREENGYRLFDELNVEKMKRVLDLRDLGYSIENVIEISTDRGATKRASMITKLRKEAEQEIRELGKRIEKIRAYERCTFENQRYKDGFNVEFDATLCIDCPHLTECDKRSYFVRQGEVFYLNDQYQVEKIEPHCIVTSALDYKDECRLCRENKLHYKYLYRGVFRYEGDEGVKQLLERAYREVEAVGYKLENKAYITKRVLLSKEGDYLCVDIRIPIAQKNNS